MLNEIKEVYLKNMDSLLQEISLYTNENDIWKTDQGISNSGGNLTLHLLGNLNYFIGTMLGKTGYVRNRESEFSDKDIAQKILISQIQETRKMIENTLSSFSDDNLLQPYPIDKFGKGKTNGYTLFYLLAHLNYHLGQVNYHRRLLNK